MDLGRYDTKMDQYPNWRKGVVIGAIECTAESAPEASRQLSETNRSDRALRGGNPQRVQTGRPQGLLLAFDVQGRRQDENGLRASRHGRGGAAMDKGVSAPEGIDTQGNKAVPGDHPSPRRKAAGRKPKPCINPQLTAQAAAGTAGKVFPGLQRRFDGLPDPRRQEMCRYSGGHVWFSGVIMYPRISSAFYR